MSDTTAVADAPATDAPASTAPPAATAEAPVATDTAVDASGNVIEIRNLTKIYRDFWGRKKVQAVNSLSLDVKRGEIFGLLGPNGSGKTTTMKMLLGLLFPSDGQISILGQKPDDVEMKSRIGYLPEESYLYRFLNADETLNFYGRLFNIPAGERKKRADRLIKQVGLEKARRQQLKEYSKGMTRRVGLAQALINDPELVLLDEPTSGLDPLGTADMKEMIRGLKNEGKTVIMCSHLLADVQDVCDRVAILYRGELKIVDSVDNLLTARDEMQLTTSEIPDAAVEEVRAVLEKHGATLRDVSHPRQSLEDLFLNIVARSETQQGRVFTAEDAAKLDAEVRSQTTAASTPGAASTAGKPAK